MCPTLKVFRLCHCKATVYVETTFHEAKNHMIGKNHIRP